MPYDNRNPNFRNPNKKAPEPYKIKSLKELQGARSAMRSGNLSPSEQAEIGGAIQDLYDDI